MHTVAPLTNVALCRELAGRLATRRPHLPGIGVMHGPAGLGKSSAAVYAANEHDAYYIELAQIWGRKDFLAQLARLVGARTRGTAATLEMAIVEALAIEPRMVLIDEADHAFARGYEDSIRNIQKKTGVPIILIGEEALPMAVNRNERLAGMVLTWAPAQAATADDAEVLARLYAPQVRMSRDLTDRIASEGGGRIRRICVGIDAVRDWAEAEGLDAVDTDAWGNRPFWDVAPARVRRI
ncbi:AAA family ATPase [Tistrella mobilis]|uniref:AAA family ATPase n=1 Tax=Tistrella mobilis TaxID=171437 RepID=UPI0035579594